MTVPATTVVPIEPEHLAYWQEYYPVAAEFTAPSDPEGCIPCTALVTTTIEHDAEYRVIRVPWKLSPEDIQRLKDGGTLWLSTWGGLPAHMLEVQAAWEDGS